MIASLPGFSNDSLIKVREMLDFADAQQTTGECRPKPQPRSPEQKQATREAQQAAQQQGETFDQKPQQQVEQMGRQGGQAERKPPLPICPS